jgi:hypothetical protein
MKAWIVVSTTTMKRPETTTDNYTDGTGNYGHQAGQQPADGLA